MIITLDGPSGTGKSSVAKSLSIRLGWPYYNTGALYRALGAYLLEEGLIDQTLEKVPEDLLSRLASIQMHLEEQPELTYWVGGRNMTHATRDHSLSLFISKLSALASIRSYLLGLQRQLGAKGRAIFDGRDMGTTVFPYADFKFYLTANSLIRAKRRYDELKELGQESGTLDQLQEQIEQRDRQDRERAISPLRKPHDAQEIDTSLLSIDQVVETICSHLKRSGLSI